MKNNIRNIYAFVAQCNMPIQMFCQNHLHFFWLIKSIIVGRARLYSAGPDCPFAPSVTFLLCSYPRQSVMSKRNNNMDQARLHQIIHNVSNLPGEPEPRKTWLSVLSSPSLTKPERSGRYWSIIYLVSGQACPGQRRTRFWYPWSLLVRISATTQLFAQSISDLINRQDRQLCAGQADRGSPARVLGSLDQDDL